VQIIEEEMGPFEYVWGLPSNWGVRADENTFKKTISFGAQYVVSDIDFNSIYPFFGSVGTQAIYENVDYLNAPEFPLDTTFYLYKTGNLPIAEALFADTLPAPLPIGEWKNLTNPISFPRRRDSC